MPQRINEHGQQIGPNVPAWTPRARPHQSPLTGEYAAVVRLDPAAHGNDLLPRLRPIPVVQCGRICPMACSLSMRCLTRL